MHLGDRSRTGTLSRIESERKPSKRATVFIYCGAYSGRLKRRDKKRQTTSVRDEKPVLVVPVVVSQVSRFYRPLVLAPAFRPDFEAPPDSESSGISEWRRESEWETKKVTSRWCRSLRTIVKSGRYTNRLGTVTETRVSITMATCGQIKENACDDTCRCKRVY